MNLIKNGVAAKGVLAAAMFLPWSGVLAAEPTAHATLREIAQKAVLNSPETLSKWHAYRAADEEIGVARGGFLPRVDLTAGTGQESLKEPQLSDRKNYHHTGYLVSLNQMLFDGFATYNEVRKLDKARLVRYYELLEASENVALEAAKAYIDVMRYRFLVDLAEDNYVQHRATYEQLLIKTQSGVGRRVDLEQAESRLAQAEVNLSTETANLHDVTARYQRLVGAQPPRVVFSPALIGKDYPTDARSAASALLRKNPTLLASIENIEASQFEVNAKRAAYVPRVDLKARTQSDDNYQGQTGDRQYNVAEVVLSWNLFNGGSDRARERQMVERRNVALDLREKACRDTRQTLLIAYNDVRRLREQSSYLLMQVGLLEKTRDAYRDQYNVGQRTLLDVLDTENELLTVRRSAINADADLTLGYLRTYAGMGSLLEVLGLQRLEAPTPGQEELVQVAGEDLCPSDPVANVRPDRESLNARALALVKASSALPGVLTVPSSLPGGVSKFAGVEADIERQLRGWLAAWSARDLTRYLAFYGPDFAPDGGLSRQQWENLRKTRLSAPDSISVEVDEVSIRREGDDRAFVNFRQVYQSSLYRDKTRKTLDMVRIGGQWLIVRETSVPCAGNTVGGCQ